MEEQGDGALLLQGHQHQGFLGRHVKQGCPVAGKGMNDPQFHSNSWHAMQVCRVSVLQLMLRLNKWQAHLMGIVGVEIVAEIRTLKLDENVHSVSWKLDHQVTVHHVNKEVLK